MDSRQFQIVRSHMLSIHRRAVDHIRNSNSPTISSMPLTVTPTVSNSIRLSASTDSINPSRDSRLNEQSSSRTILTTSKGSNAEPQTSSAPSQPVMKRSVPLTKIAQAGQIPHALPNVSEIPTNPNSGPHIPPQSATVTKRTLAQVGPEPAKRVCFEDTSNSTAHFEPNAKPNTAPKSNPSISTLITTKIPEIVKVANPQPLSNSSESRFQSTPDASSDNTPNSQLAASMAEQEDRYKKKRDGHAEAAFRLRNVLVNEPKVQGLPGLTRRGLLLEAILSLKRGSTFKSRCAVLFQFKNISQVLDRLNQKVISRVSKITLPHTTGVITDVAIQKKDVDEVIDEMKALNGKEVSYKQRLLTAREMREMHLPYHPSGLLLSRGPSDVDCLEIWPVFEDEDNDQVMEAPVITSKPIESVTRPKPVEQSAVNKRPSGRHSASQYSSPYSSLSHIVSDMGVQAEPVMKSSVGGNTVSTSRIANSEHPSQNRNVGVVRSKDDEIPPRRTRLPHMSMQTERRNLEIETQTDRNFTDAEIQTEDKTVQSEAQTHTVQSPVMVDASTQISNHFSGEYHYTSLLQEARQMTIHARKELLSKLSLQVSILQQVDFEDFRRESGLLEQGES